MKDVIIENAALENVNRSLSPKVKRFVKDEN